MKQILIPFFVLSMSTTPVMAETPKPEEGVDLMEEGARLLLRGLLDEVDPAIEEFRDLAEAFGPRMQLFTEEMGPAFAELFDQIDDIGHYMAPEILPNGDIIMRRSETAPVFEPQGAPDIEL